MTGLYLVLALIYVFNGGERTYFCIIWDSDLSVWFTVTMSPESWLRFLLIADFLISIDSAAAAMAVVSAAVFLLRPSGELKL
jgi:hypothetical protein